MINPDLISKFIDGNQFIDKLYSFDELDSTNDYAKKNKVPANSLVITNHQKLGRGRLDRQWESEKNKNLTFSLVKKININLKDQVNIVYYSAYSLYSVIKKILTTSGKSNNKYGLDIKWPNDILLNNKKIAGILIETMPITNIYVIGVGINVNQQTFSTETSGIATSLCIETGKTFDLNNLFEEIIQMFLINYSIIEEYKFSNIYNLWKKCINCIGQTVLYFDKFGKKIQGRVIDITPSGHIIIEENTIIRTYNSEDIKLII